MTRDDDDLLKQATRALRETSTPSEQELADGRAVLLWAQRSAKRQTPRGRTLRWVLPLAAVLTAGTALAASTGQLEWVGAAVERCVDAVRIAQPAKSMRSKARHDAPTQGGTLAVADSPATVAVADAGSAGALDAAPSTPAPPAPAKEPARRSKEVGSLRPTAPAAVEATPATREPLPPPAIEVAAAEPRRSADLAAYREAHRLHFGRRDFATALGAWDAYLEGYPQGTFALEALYNRAICLLRLGRKDEARRALAPFARGAMQNHYRQTEAAELLEALE